MVSLLAKWFIKEKPEAGKPEIRHRYGVLCSIVGIALNLLLVAGKLIAGAVSGSIAITADGLNNLSDAGSSLITLIGFKLAQQKPDEEHPFGHGRMEYVAGLLVSIIILIMGLELLRTSIDKIINPSPVTFSVLAMAILVVSILIKLYMAYYNSRIGKAIESAPMRATAIDSLSDVGATLVVLISMIVAHLTGLPIDGWCGVLVALLIAYGGIAALRDTVNLLLGQPPKQAYVQEIRDIVMANPEIVGVHDLMVHDYGPGRRMITLHAEVPANGNMLALHDMIDNIEGELLEKMSCKALIHMDPVVTDDALTEETKKRVAQVVLGLDERVSIHDFRMVAGPTHTNLIFDISVPFDVKISDRVIRQRVANMIQALDGTFFAVVTVDRVSEAFEGI